MTESPDILLVEDNPNDLELTLRAFKKSGAPYRVQIAKDGVEALDFLRSGGMPKVIFLDHKLPRIDGMEVLRQIRLQESTKYIPVIMLTSSQQDRDISESYRLGVNSYIVKPVDFEKFAEMIASLGHYWLALNHSSR